MSSSTLLSVREECATVNVKYECSGTTNSGKSITVSRIGSLIVYVTGYCTDNFGSAFTQELNKKLSPFLVKKHDFNNINRCVFKHDNFQQISPFNRCPNLTYMKASYDITLDLCDLTRPAPTRYVNHTKSSANGMQDIGENFQNDGSYSLLEQTGDNHTVTDNGYAQLSASDVKPCKTRRNKINSRTYVNQPKYNKSTARAAHDDLDYYTDTIPPPQVPLDYGLHQYNIDFNQIDDNESLSECDGHEGVGYVEDSYDNGDAYGSDACQPPDTYNDVPANCANYQNQPEYNHDHYSGKQKQRNIQQRGNQHQKHQYQNQPAQQPHFTDKRNNQRNQKTQPYFTDKKHNQRNQKTQPRPQHSDNRYNKKERHYQQTTQHDNSEYEQYIPQNGHNNHKNRYHNEQHPNHTGIPKTQPHKKTTRPPVAPRPTKYQN
jgi:hypothetical protein